MTIQFDNSGHALQNGTETVYTFDNAGVFTGKAEAQIVIGSGIPANSTLIEPPEATEGHAAIFHDGAWEIIEDHRNDTVWNKADGSPGHVTELGPMPSTLTTTKPTGLFVAWDDHTNAWQFSQTLRDTQMENAANSALKAVMAQAPQLTVMGQVFGAKTQAYVKALRAIIEGTDTTATTLPPVPSDLTT